ncbi:MAG: L-seryl-tRNA(Sec) selenium transferase [Caldilineales bacterium]|nr:L-seryl-tRNA(Sec) selenium transferase [Caldilineales bacterium]
MLDSPTVTNPYRHLPSIDRLLDQPELVAVIDQFGREQVRNAARRVLDDARAAIGEGGDAPDLDALMAAVQTTLATELAPTLRPVLNATGVVIHTNLGRAPLSQAAMAAMMAATQGYSNLEYDLDAGRRGSRYVHAERMICELTGAEAALVVNNNAAAVTLALRSLAGGKDVIISRGELVEIGGGFRIPDILEQSGARLLEVGTTNRTRLADYERAITPASGALLKVHQSNFQIVGFSEAVGLSELVELGRRHDLPVIDDLGSGTLLDTTPFGLAYEPTVQDSVRSGATLTTFSGDKLLGGPQAGILVGKADVIARLKQEPLTRALRVDKTTLAALQATLLAYLRGTATTEIPVWQMITARPEELAMRAKNWQDRLSAESLPVELRPGSSTVGGGSLPSQTLPTTLLALISDQPDRLAALLRAGEPAVIARIESNTLVLDPRTILPGEDDTLLAAISAAWQKNR